MVERNQAGLRRPRRGLETSRRSVSVSGDEADAAAAAAARRRPALRSGGCMETHTGPPPPPHHHHLHPLQHYSMHSLGTGTRHEKTPRNTFYNQQTEECLNIFTQILNLITYKYEILIL